MEYNLITKGKIFNPVEISEYSTGGIVSHQILSKEIGNISLFTFDKGQKLSEHSAPFDALVQVLEGEVEVNINRKPLILKAGDMVIMPANIPHSLNAISKFKMILTMIKGE
ncbi:cupin domain-containing protein [Marinilabiliaceae bacterium JC040]|nr:cupin domain-containing protein [Marinilabiliaceae bacterium JC040]